MNKLFYIPLLYVPLFFFNLNINSSIATENSSNEDRTTVRITKIMIKGGKAISRKKIKESMATEFPSIKPWVKKPEFHEEILKDDMIRIKNVYNKNGYYDAIAKYKLKYSKDENSVEITINIKEGKPVILTELNLNYKSGLDEPIRKKIIDSIPLKVNKTFSQLSYEITKNLILNILSDDGYPKAEVLGEALVNRREQRVKATFIINPGRRYEFGVIKIEGNEKVKTSLIKREILYKIGEVYSLKKVNDTEAKLFQLGFFRSVIIDTDFNEQELIGDTTIRVSERKLGTVKIGAGFGTEDKLRGQIIWIERNLFGSGRTLVTSVKASFITQRFQTQIIQPYIIGRNSDLSINFDVERDDVPSFEGVTLLNTFRISKRFKDIYNAFGAFNIQFAKVESSNVRTPEEESRGDFFLTFFNGAIERITTDSILNPTSGTSISLGLESSSKAIGSDVNYVKGIIDLRGFKALSNVVFAKRISIGVIQPFGSTETLDIPIFKRFFAGGSNSMRGFPFQKLGPLNRKDEPLGGNSLLIGSFETRFPLYKNLGGVIFFDYGNVYTKQWDFRFGDIKYAPGIGLRYNTLIGPIRFDVGYALNPEPGINRFQYWISIGQAF
ncbi:MAG: outer membrane protein assembly factor BamA [Thermodesulfobacteriota bacterium]